MAERRYRAKNFSIGGGVENVDFIAGRAKSTSFNRLTRSLDRLSAAAFNFAANERKEEVQVMGNSIYQGETVFTDSLFAGITNTKLTKIF